MKSMTGQLLADASTRTLHLFSKSGAGSKCSYDDDGSSVESRAMEWHDFSDEAVHGVTQVSVDDIEGASDVESRVGALRDFDEAIADFSVDLARGGCTLEGLLGFELWTYRRRRYAALRSDAPGPWIHTCRRHGGDRSAL